MGALTVGKRDARDSLEYAMRAGLILFMRSTVFSGVFSGVGGFFLIRKKAFTPRKFIFTFARNYPAVVE